MPVGNSIDPGYEDALFGLERRSHAVWLVRGYSAIDAARNQMASEALAQGFDEIRLHRSAANRCGKLEYII